MSSNDLVKREDVLARKCKYYVYDEAGFCRNEFAVPVEDIERISAVPVDSDAGSRKALGGAVEYAISVLNTVNGNHGLPDYGDYLDLYNAITVIADVLEALPDAPHEMTAREFMRIHDAICHHQHEGHDIDSDTTVCFGCPLEDWCDGCGSADEAITIADAWAQEHSEVLNGGA